MSTLPLWVTVTVVLGLLGLLGYSVIVLGAAGYPIDMIIGGLLGGYAGLQELAKRKGGGGNNDGDDK